MNTQSNRPFAEVIESSIYNFTAQTWQWNEFPLFGSLISASVSSRTLFGIVHDIKTGSNDPHRQPFIYQKTPEELAQEQPQIFAFLQTTFICQIIGYRQGPRIYYLLAPEPLPIHTFIQNVTLLDACNLLSCLEYLHLLFAGSGTIHNIDELLLSLVQRYSQLFEDHLFLPKFMSIFSILVNNDYRRIKIFAQRLQSSIYSHRP